MQQRELMPRNPNWRPTTFPIRLLTTCIIHQGDITCPFSHRNMGNDFLKWIFSPMTADDAR